MSIRPVRTEKDYKAALERVESLRGGAKSPAEADELEVLLTLVRQYEGENHLAIAQDPVQAIRLVMDRQGLKQADLIPYLGSRSRVSEILSGKRKLSLAMIRALHTGLGIPAEVLIREGPAPGDGRGVPWERFPVKEIKDRGWVDGLDPTTQPEEIMRRMAAQADAPDFFARFVSFRQDSRRNAKDDPYAVQAWVLGVLFQARQIGLSGELVPEELDQTLMERVVHFSVLSDGPLKAAEFLAGRGIKVVAVPHFKRTYLDGGSMISPEGTPIVGLTLRHDRLDHFWLTLLHELAHIVLGHLDQAEGRCILDDLELRDPLDAREVEADRLAQEALISSRHWKRHRVRTTGRITDVRDLARKLSVHPAIVAGRVRYEKQNYRLLARHVGQGEVRCLFQ